MTFAPDGTLFATLDDKLYTLDTSDGVATAVGSSDPTMDTGFSSISGIAFATVPEPSSFISLAIGVTGLIGLYVRARNRRR